MNPIVLTRRTTAIILSVATVVTVVLASILANFLIPSQVTITAQPGLCVTDSATAQPITNIQWGDVQQTQSVSRNNVRIANCQGTLTMYILDRSASGVPISSLMVQGQTQPSVTGIQGVTLSWNLAAIYPDSCGQGYPCVALAPGSGTQPLTLTLSADGTAATGSHSFTIEILAYSTNAG